MTLEGGRTTVPLVVVTDVGSHFDDALALAYLARQPRCELLGVIATELRPDAVSSLLVQLGRGDVRVSDDSNDLVRSVLEGRPGEVTLLTLGPLTSIAKILDEDARALDRAHAVVSMIGDWNGSEPEANAAADPEAARRVIAARHRGHRFVGLDATAGITLAPDRARRLLDRLPEAISDLTRITDDGELPCHDAVAAASVFAPDLCGWIGGDAEITSSGRTSRLASNGPFAFATTVAAERFRRHLEEILHP